MGFSAEATRADFDLFRDVALEAGGVLVDDFVKIRLEDYSPVTALGIALGIEWSDHHTLLQRR